MECFCKDGNLRVVAKERDDVCVCSVREIEVTQAMGK